MDKQVMNVEKQSLALSACLAGLNKSDMAQIRANLGIQGVSSLKKQELIDVLVEQIPARLPEFLKTWDENRFQFIKQTMDQGGETVLELEYQQQDYYQAAAILFSSKRENGDAVLVMPKEIMDCFQQLDNPGFRDILRRNTEWIKLTQGLLFYYGALSIGELESFIEKYTGVKPDSEEYLFIMEQAEVYYQEIVIDMESHLMSNGFVQEPEQVRQAQRDRQDLVFCPFSKAELLRAGEPLFIDQNPVFSSFLDLITKNYTISRKDASFIVEECVYDIRNGGGPSETFKVLQSQLEVDSVDAVKVLMEHIILLQNHTKQWELKGYSPNELTSNKSKTIPQKPAEVVSLATRQKIGRNDPCPCGSGKKFKKCCGA